MYLFFPFSLFIRSVLVCTLKIDTLETGRRTLWKIFIKSESGCGRARLPHPDSDLRSFENSNTHGDITQKHTL